MGNCNLIHLMLIAGTDTILGLSPKEAYSNEQTRPTPQQQVKGLVHANREAVASSQQLAPADARRHPAMRELCKAIYLECWYQHVLGQICSMRTKPSRRAFLTRTKILARGL